MRPVINITRSRLGRLLLAAILYVVGLLVLVILMNPILQAADWTKLKLLVVLAGPIVLLFGHVPIVVFVIAAAIPFLFIELAVYSTKGRTALAVGAMITWFGCGLLMVV